MIMQNSQLHAVGRTQTGAKQLAPVILAVWKLNGNTHDRMSGSVNWWRGCCSPCNSWTSRKNQALMEVKMIQPNPSQITVFWVASSYKPYIDGLVKRRFCFSMFLRVTSLLLFFFRWHSMTLADRRAYLSRKGTLWYMSKTTNFMKKPLPLPHGNWRSIHQLVSQYLLRSDVTTFLLYCACQIYKINHLFEPEIVSMPTLCVASHNIGPSICSINMYWILTMFKALWDIQIQIGHHVALREFTVWQKCIWHPRGHLPLTMMKERSLEQRLSDPREWRMSQGRFPF